MSNNSPNERMRLLDEQLRHHDWKYHVEDAPEIENDAYDALEREFRGLCEEYPELAIQFDSHTKTVPIDLPADGPLEIIKFNDPMLSVKKIHTLEDLAKFISKLPDDTQLVHELKLDGMALRLLYKQGLLVSMATRGAGMVGEEVIHALPLFAKDVIPERIETDLDELEIRGEAWISMRDYLEYNESVEAADRKKDPRNAVSGWIRTHPSRMDHKVLDTLQFSAYWSDETFGLETYREVKEKLRSLRFDTPNEVTHDHIVKNLRSDMIPTDGIMVKVDSLKLQKELGVGNRHPNWSVGYKFPPAEGTPKVVTVEWSTSGYGRVVPVVIYTPIKLGGAMFTRASLDNYGNFMELGLGEGDTVSVTRNNDVIPRLNHVISSGDGVALEAPTECPSCSALLEVRIGKTGSELVCNNLSGCPGQLINRTVIMGDKFGLDIDGLGPVIVHDLVQRTYIKQPADVFSLGAGANNLMSDLLKANIEKVKNQPVPLHRFIKALCLPDIGTVLSKRIANAIISGSDGFASSMVLAYHENSDKDVFKSMFEVLMTKLSFLNSVQGISNGIAMSVVRSISSPMFDDNFSAMVDALVLDFGKMEESGYKVAITGSFDQGKDALIKYFAEHGIELTDKLTLDCKYLIVGERAGKAKTLKATDNAIPMLDVNQYPSIEHLINYIKENSV
jgi:DNA ligase (NAD+)